ncbi:N-acetyl sugar amidotransferase [Chryseobacterium caseinilyticum]|uniref:N-acetyl sugar amidotransferase n=1 Tax=Chryseobacterium caseinilyticum TaxID=2771428 RepID=A0ABR8ZAR4_9FLAO|nr:N-acetyl sugar amidotransferase [Chryseobacterium caseinilyticum]MBD8082317.1 N-acetyl sugar amidotransferase [Chryseobacterium caseinilyticum]
MYSPKICSLTVMDDTDPKIVFNEKGESDYVTNFNENILPSWKYGNDVSGYILKVAEKIKKSRKNNSYDCIIGISGGLDSSYMLYIAKEVMGLRPLAFHVDAGWNTSQAVSNIEKLVKGLGIDLYTEVIDWEEMKDLQLAFLKSQIPDQDLPQDIAFFSALYRYARKNKIKYILTGANFSTECCKEPEDWGAYAGIDKRLITDIHRKFGKKELKKFPVIDIFEYKIFYKYFVGMHIFNPLNHIRFLKEDAENTLGTKFGWKKFGHKHHESVFTRFFEDFWLPKKFGFDRRKVHFSSLILTGQMTRNEALERLKLPEMTEEDIANEFEYVAHKLDLTVEELQNIFDGENKTFRDYKNKRNWIGLGAKILKGLGLEKRLFR